MRHSDFEHTPPHPDDILNAELHLGPEATAQARRLSQKFIEELGDVLDPLILKWADNFQKYVGSDKHSAFKAALTCARIRLNKLEEICESDKRRN